ncbi:MAG: hypothetical protein H7Y18_16930 [Clostridiaceae bacterium]|nr:hypothetical protein [Clostridiaceae bacterium]
MKALKLIIIWSLISLLLQSGTFFLADKYYQKTLMNTKVTEELVPKKQEPAKIPAISIPTTATGIQVSFDGKYLAYYDNTKLTVINCLTGKSNVVSTEKNSEQLYNKWLPDINSMVLCERDLIKKTIINIFTYNADNGDKQVPTDTNNRDIKLTLSNSKDTIGDIEMSTIMSIFYIKTVKSQSKSDIFNNNVNGKTVPIFTAKNIGNISVFPHKPFLAYEDSSTNAVKITNNSWNLGKIKACLFTTDNEDNMYVGTLENGKVKKIMYGSIDKSIDKWTSLVLDAPVDKKNVIVNKNGGIYLNNSMEGSITNLVSKQKIIYTGNLLRITDKKVFSLEDGTIQRIDLT